MSDLHTRGFRREIFARTVFALRDVRVITGFGRWRIELFSVSVLGYVYIYKGLYSSQMPGSHWLNALVCCRDDHFADEQFIAENSSKQTLSSDQRYFDEILTGYRQILAGKRIDPVDIRVKTGWWADSASSTGTCATAGKVC
jgi:hypothetical protein